MAIIIKLNSEQVNRLDLSPVQRVIDPIPGNTDITAYEQQISFDIDYSRDPEGIQYNPEALEIFLMQKIFILDHWLTQNKLPSKSRLMAMAQMLGYDLDDTFFETYTQGC